MVYIWRRIICFAACSKLGIASYLSCSHDTLDTSCTLLYSILLFRQNLYPRFPSRFVLFAFSYLLSFLVSFSCIDYISHPLLCRVGSYPLFYTFSFPLALTAAPIYWHFNFFAFIKHFGAPRSNFFELLWLFLQLPSTISLFLSFLISVAWFVLSDFPVPCQLYEAVRNIVSLVKDILQRF